MTIGLDTGFFVRLLEADEAATEVWARVVAGEASAAISCLSLYELDRQGLKGSVEKRATDTLIEELPHICRVIWLEDVELVRRAARLAHGNGLAMADAIILASLLEADVDRIYTTDSDLEAYGAGPETVLV